MQGAVPTVFAGMAQHASSPGGAARILEMLKGGGGEGTTEGAERGSSLVGNVFGDRTSNVTDVLASHSGIKSSSATRILGFVGPMVAGVIGKEVTSRGLDAGGIMQLFSSHKNAIMESAPPGLSDAVGIGQRPEVAEVKNIAEGPRAIAGEAGRKVQEAGGEVREIGRETGHRVRGVGEEATRHVPKKTLGPILAVLAAGALAVWGILAFGRGHNTRPGVTEMQPRGAMGRRATEPAPTGLPSAAPAPQASPENQGQGQATENQQGQATENAGGMPPPSASTPLNAPPGSPEADLERAVNDESIPLPYTAKLDKLTFDSGSSTLRPEGTAPIETVAGILEAHPSARVRVEGFADSTGDPAANQALSEARATAVKDALEASGISADRVEMTGHGVSAGSTNETEQGRSFNRRAEIVVLSR
jgi:outer membrane protein OmpA-like peptidoglycan-associated protein